MEKKNLSQQTADRLYNMIVVERRLAPGEKLPNEMDLARDLGVSRTTLREALHALASRNILEVRRGRGTFVSPQVEHINDFGFSDLDQVKGQLRDLFELRRIFEPSAARLACLRATPEEMSEILSRGEEVDRCIRENRDRTQADREFHAAIVRATHNEFMMRLLPMINQAVEAAVISGEQSRSTDSTSQAMTTSLRRSLGNRGRMGRSIRREARTAGRLGLPSRRIKLPGMRPTA